MITIMGIVANKRKIILGDIEGSVEKIMAEGPRRVAGLNVEIRQKGAKLAIEERAILEKLAIDCPVAQSIHPSIKVDFNFIYE